MVGEESRIGARILVVDDDVNILDVLKIRLEIAGYTVTATADEQEALSLAKQACFDMGLIDLQLKHTDGISIMQELHIACPDMPVIIMTAHSSIETAVDAMQKGAFNYVMKPFNSQDLLLQLDRALEKFRLASEVKRLREFSEQRFGIPGIIAESPAMRSVIDQVRRIAPIDSTVFIHGESGTGKELIAKTVHLASPVVMKHLLPSIVLQYRRHFLRVSYSDMKRVLSRVLTGRHGAFSSVHTKDPSSLMKLGTCPCHSRQSCSGFCRNASSNPVAAKPPLKLMFVLSWQPTRIWRTRSKTELFGKISSIVSMSYRFIFRRSGNGKKIYLHSHSTSSLKRAKKWARKPRACLRCFSKTDGLRMAGKHQGTEQYDRIRSCHV